ncbi:hypothetical protein FRC03_011796 [Tulasnella sp. 419]|nr:hypothetical protein FRC03_011796 [Tulasnella sp. 419]
MVNSSNCSISKAHDPETPRKNHSSSEEFNPTSATSTFLKGSLHPTPISAFNSHCISTHFNQQFQAPRLTEMSTFQRHPSFFSSLLPDLPSRSHFSVSCLRSLPDDCWDKTSGQFGFTTLQNEKYMYEPLVKTLNAIITFMTIESTSTFGSPECPATSSSKIKSPVLPVYEFVGTYQDFANRDGLEEGVKEEPHRNRRPDIAMVLKSPDGLRRSWYDVALSIEVKKDRWAHAIAQAEDQAEAILTNAPTKRFLFSFLLCDSSLEVCLWDRAGMITSEPIDVNESPLQFIEVVRRFASMSPMELGFDETAIDIPEGVKSPIQRGPIGSPVVAIDQDIYYRIKTVSCSSSCFGRSTRCFEARKLVKGKGKWSNKTYLLKYFWNDVKRQPDEGEIYERVKKANVTSGVADCVAFVRLTKLSDIRKGLPLLRDEAKEEKNHSSEKVEIGGLIGDRQLCVLVLATVGRSISEPTTVYELIAAMKTAIKGHQEIYQRAGILHRDISTNNVRIRDPPMVFVDGVDEDDINDRNTSLPSDDGFLIDFDLSMIEDDSDQNRSERLARTGTFAFMAWQIMDGDSISMEEDDGAPDTPLHSFKHDLQSFFWVLLYICAGCPWFT